MSCGRLRDAENRERKGREMEKRKKMCAVAGIGLCIMLAAGAAGRYFVTASAKESKRAYRETALEHGDLQMTFTGEGVTTAGTILQEADFDVSAVDFVVEKTYAASGDEVKQGDALYKLSDASIAEATAYYEEAVAKALKASSRAKTAYESGKAEAEYEREKSKADAQSAKESCDAANNEAAQKVTEAEETLAEANRQISVYQTNLEQNQYYADAGASEKKKSYEEAKKAEEQALKASEKAKAEYDAAVAAVNEKLVKLQEGAAAASSLQSVAGIITDAAAAGRSLTEKKDAFEKAENAWQSAREKAEKAKAEYDAANLSYEKSVSEASARKEELERSLDSLQLAYTNAVNAAEEEKIKNENERDTALLAGEYADDVYENTVANLKAACDTADDALSELQKEQSALLALEDGVVTAAWDGILSGVLYEAGDTLAGDSVIAQYLNQDIITVAVEVSQEDISKISVGDKAEVSIAGMPMESREGEICYIATSATSERSMSNVTYTAEIALDNSENQIARDTSAYVTFTYGELLNEDYILTDALDNVEGTSATVKTYGANGEIEEIPVTIGDTYGRYTVIKEGLADDVTCLIEMEEGFKEGNERPERTEDGMGEGAGRPEKPEGNANEGEKAPGQAREEQKEGGNMNGRMEK